MKTKCQDASKRRLSVFLRLVLCLSSSLFFTTDSKGQGMLGVDSLIIKYLKSGKDSKALELWTESIESRATNEDCDTLADQMYAFCKVWHEVKQHNSFIEILLDVVGDNQFLDSSTSCKSWLQIGLTNYLIDQKLYSQAEPILESILTSSQGETRFWALFYLGQVSYFTYDTDKAIQYFRQTKSSYNDLDESNPTNYADVCNFLAACYWAKSNMDSAQISFEEGYNFLAGQLDEDSKMQRTIIASNLFLIYNNKGEWDKAERIIKSVLSSYDELIRDASIDQKDYLRKKKIISLNNLVGLYQDQGYHNSCLHIARLSLKEIEALSEPDVLELIKNNILIGQLLTTSYEFFQSNENLYQALVMLDSLEEPDEIWYNEVYSTLAQNYEHLQMSDSAIKYYDLAIEGFRYTQDKGRGSLLNKKYYSSFLAEIDSCDRSLRMSNSLLDFVQKNYQEYSFEIEDYKLNVLQNYQSCKKWAECLELADRYARELHKNFSRYENKNRKTRFKLEYQLAALNSEFHIGLSSLSTIQSLIVRTEKLLKDYDSLQQVYNEQDGEIFLRSKQDCTNLLLGLHTTAHRMDQKEEHLYSILSILEETSQFFIRQQFLSSSSPMPYLPEDLINDELDLLRLRERMSLGDASLVDILSYDSLFSQFIRELSKRAPKYYELKYAPIEFQAELISNYLTKKEALVVLYEYEDHLYSVLVHDGKPKLFSHGTMVGGYLDEVEYSSQKDEWASLLKENSELSEIILIPSGSLFGKNILSSLLTSEISAEGGINWCFYPSISSFTRAISSNRRSTSSVITMFASKYGVEDIADNYGFSLDEANKCGLKAILSISLPMNYNLVRALSKKFKTRLLLDKNSNKSNFINISKEKGVLHLSSHVYLDDRDPSKSFIKFNNRSASDNSCEDFIFVKDLFALDYECDLAVLATCESGVASRDIPMKGALSLAAGFLYGGASSVLMTLWKTDEKATAEILEYFYENLSRGLRKSEALRKAKLEYIDNCQYEELKDPYYWAGLVIYGDDSPIKLRKRRKTELYIIGSLAVLALVVVAGLNRKNHYAKAA